MARVAGGGELALDAAMPEAPGDDDAVDTVELADDLTLEVLGVHPAELHLDPVVDRGVAESLDDAHVGVGHLHVLAHDGDANGRPRRVHPGDELGPLDEVRWARGDVELLDDEVSEPRLLE